MIHPASLSDEQLLKQCTISFQRRSGPGGQNRNKVETAAILLHKPTGIIAEANERRSQAENKAVALTRLRIKFALEVRMPRAGLSKPWESRVKEGKISINPKHEDFPSLLAEALDVLSLTEMDIKAAAEKLSCSTSQLTKFLKLEPRAFASVNAQRTQRGLKAYL